MGALVGKSAVRTPGVLSDEGKFPGDETLGKESWFQVELFVIENLCHPRFIENLFAGFEREQ